MDGVDGQAIPQHKGIDGQVIPQAAAK